MEEILGRLLLIAFLLIIASLPFNVVSRLRSNLATTQRLIAQARG